MRLCKDCIAKTELSEEDIPKQIALTAVTCDMCHTQISSSINDIHFVYAININKYFRNLIIPPMDGEISQTYLSTKYLIDNVIDDTLEKYDKLRKDNEVKEYLKPLHDTILDSLMLTRGAFIICSNRSKDYDQNKLRDRLNYIDKYIQNVVNKKILFTLKSDCIDVQVKKEGLTNNYQPKYLSTSEFDGEIICVDNIYEKDFDGDLLITIPIDSENKNKDE